MCYFDKNEEIDIHDSRDLPHWHQDGKIQFVTFRLADSLPQSKIADIKRIQIDFVMTHPRPWSDETTNAYWKLIGPIENRLLDNGYGSCILKNPDVRDILSTALRYFDKSRYDLIAYVIMPNHVHMVLRVLEGYTLDKCMHSIKSFSAKAINKKLNRRGPVWQKESFDRIIRNSAHLDHCINYIKNNPNGLPQSDYELYGGIA